MRVICAVIQITPDSELYKASYIVNNLVNKSISARSNVIQQVWLTGFIGSLSIQCRSKEIPPNLTGTDCCADPQHWLLPSREGEYHGNRLAGFLYHFFPLFLRVTQWLLGGCNPPGAVTSPQLFSCAVSCSWMSALVDGVSSLERGVGFWWAVLLGGRLWEQWYLWNITAMAFAGNLGY